MFRCIVLTQIHSFITIDTLSWLGTLEGKNRSLVPEVPGFMLGSNKDSFFAGLILLRVFLNVDTHF